MTTITKAYKIKLVKPIESKAYNDNWESVGKHLNHINYLVPKIKNKAATDTLIYIKNCFDYENKHGKGTYKDYFKKTYGKVIRSHIEYECVRDSFMDKIEDYYGELFKASAYQSHNATLNQMSEILKGNSSLNSYKKDQPIIIKSNKFNIYLEDNKYYIDIPLFSPNKAKELGRIGARKTYVRFLLDSKNKNSKLLLNRFISGEYKLCDSNIQKQGKDWYFIATYQFEKEEKVDLIPNKILGLDMGIAKAVVMAISDSPKWEAIEGGEIEQFRNKVEYRRNQMRHQLRYNSENRHGHGRKTLLSPLEVLESKVSDFRKLTNHRYAKYIVEYAVKNQCSIIQMEDLSGINTRSAFLKRWSYFDLQTKIESKAKEYGIEVRKISPKYTSQRCNNCGVISKDNREDQATYKCSCQRKTRKGMQPYKINADLNAARNIALDNIEQIIYEQALSQGLIKPKENKKKTKKQKVS